MISSRTTFGRLLGKTSILTPQLTSLRGSMLRLIGVATLGVVAAQSGWSQTLWSEDFEAYDLGEDLADWVDTAGGSSTSVSEGRFLIGNLNGQQAISTSSEINNIHSHLSGISSVTSSSGYEYRGRFLITEDNGGIGLTVFSDYPNSDKYYRLRRYDLEPTLHLTHHGSNISGDLDTGVTPEAQSWYWFLIRVESTSQSTSVKVKIWKDGTTEPTVWQADASSTGSNRLTSGTVGLWSYGVGEKFWDDLSVTGLNGSGEPDPDPEPDPEPETVAVPDLAGMTLAEAETAAEALGLSIGSTTYQFSASATEEEVVSQSLSAGQQAALGASIDLELIKPLPSSSLGLSLSWVDNSENEQGFEVERALSGESFELLTSLPGNSTSYIDSNLTPGFVYEYRVRAFNAYGYSPYTNVASGQRTNSAPVIDDAVGVSALRGENLDTVVLEFADAESPYSQLGFEVLSSNLELLPLENIDFEVGDGTVEVSFQPVALKTGTSTVTVIVSDGLATDETDFVVEVLQNQGPSVSSVSAVEAYDGQDIGPVSFTVGDAESSAGDLSVTAISLNESIIPSNSILVSGTGANRSVSFTTLGDISGSATIRLTVSDGVNLTNGAIPVTVETNGAPTIDGLATTYTLEDGARISELPFTVGDAESGPSNLEISVSSSNAGLVLPSAVKVSGFGSQRTLDVIPVSGTTGSADITIAVSDGIKTTEHTFTLQVLAPEAVVEIVEFYVRKGIANIEVINRPSATYTLWKIHSLGGAWEQVTDAVVVPGVETTLLQDPKKVGKAVCYRVVASE